MAKDVIALGGQDIIDKYHGSLRNALRAAYPEHYWKSSRRAKGYWKDTNNQRAFIQQLATNLSIHCVMVVCLL
jgi:hypothetical protein